MPTMGNIELIITPEDAERFWALVDRQGGAAACWPYSGPKKYKALGNFRLPQGWVLAQRVAYQLGTGRSPTSKVQARCPSEGCVNPSHLRCADDPEWPERQCSVCHAVKPLEAFYQNRVHGRWKHTSRCKSCMDRQSVQWCENNLAQFRKKRGSRTRRYRENHHMEQWLYRIQFRARKKGREFDLELSDIEVPDRCPVLGIPLKFGKDGNGRGGNDALPSVDRIDNLRGYTKDNIVVVSLRANRLKSDATVDELMAVAEFYQRISLDSTSGGGTKS